MAASVRARRPRLPEHPRRAGRPTIDEAERLNTKITEAAFRVFIREGYDAATFDQIARESHTTRRSVKHRFPAKEFLLLAVVEVKMRDQIVDVVSPAALASPKPLEALREVCASMLEAVDDNQLVEFYRLVVAEAAKVPPVSAAFLRLNDRLEMDLQSLVERVQRAGHFAACNSRAIAALLVGAFVSNPLNRITMGDAQFRTASYRRQYFSEVWAFLTRQA